jgi:hypothetical protein
MVVIPADHQGIDAQNKIEKTVISVVHIIMILIVNHHFQKVIHSYPERYQIDLKFTFLPGLSYFAHQVNQSGQENPTIPANVGRHLILTL